MDRRAAIKFAVAGALAANISVAQAQSSNAPGDATVVRPGRLKKGDTIGLIAPASNAWEDENIRISIDIVRSLGFRVRQGEHLFLRTNYLAGPDAERADDVNRMFADDNVDAIFCLRGGYGTARILPYLDYDVIARNPKVLLGYSDITGILTAIHVKTGLVGFHGPMFGQNFTDYTLGEFKKVLVEPSTQARIAAPPPFETGEGRVDIKNRRTLIAGGVARGRLIGGNLTLVCSLMGTEFEPDFRGRILFLEDVGEAPYRVDRMLTQLWLAGKLQQLAGIAFGKFTETGGSSGNTFSIEEVLRSRCGDLGIPVVRGFMIGHVKDQTIVPIGIEAELDADEGTLTLLEEAVI
jgi:muramoyltetrapeptide carboxypeptidase